MRWVGTVVLTGLAPLGAPAALSQEKASTVDFQDLASSFLRENGLKAWIDSGPSGHTFDELLASPAFTHIELGSLDVYAALGHLKDGESTDSFRAAVEAIVDLQSAWLGWQAPTRAAEFEKDFKALHKWVKSWSRGGLSHADGGKSLVDSLGAGDAVRQSLAHLTPALQADEGTCSTLGERGLIVLGPTRRDFLTLVALAGWLDEPGRSRLWNDGLLERTIEWVGWTQLVSLQYTTLPVDPGVPFVGVDMNEDDKTGLAQYMVERAGALLLRRSFWRQDAHFFEQALAANLVIQAAGSNNLRAGEWKLEYHTSGSSTPPYERFVPGGNPAGGSLPPRPAGPGLTSGSATEVSAYRKTRGTDYFLAPLREAQKVGAKLASKDGDRRLADDKSAHFALHCFVPSSDHAVTAPFLGDLAEKQPLPPNEFINDYEEFFRAYRSGFLCWLRLHGAATEPESESEAKFAQLIAAHAALTSRESIDSSILAVYGAPLSAMDGSTDSMEWRFLAWLAKGK